MVCCASLVGGKSALDLAVPLLQCLSLPSSRLASAFRTCRQQYGLCYGKGIFHGLPSFATDDSVAFCHHFTADIAPGTLHNVKILRVPTTICGLDDLILANGERPPFDWPVRTTAHDQKHFAFRSEFRPLGILQLVNFSPVSL